MSHFWVRYKYLSLKTASGSGFTKFVSFSIQHVSPHETVKIDFATSARVEKIIVNINKAKSHNKGYQKRETILEKISIKCGRLNEN